jgi:menaquinone-dependent protoporphyrinogen oxidase
MHVLVIAASKNGATAGIADEIARTLRQADVAADVADIGRPVRVGDYDAVVLGSAVYMGRWLDAASRFATAHAAELRRLPVWLFSSGPIGSPPRPAESQPAHVGELLEVTGAREHRTFAGRIERGRLSLPQRALMRAMHVSEGDYRDWDAVRAWARDIAAALSPQRVG